MTPSTATSIKTELLRAADLPLADLLARRAAGDTVLDHCLRRVVARAESAGAGRVAAFNAAPPRQT